MPVAMLREGSKTIKYLVENEAAYVAAGCVLPNIKINSHKVSDSNVQIA